MGIVGDPRNTIDKEIAAFDEDPETALAESTIRDLISTYPNNQDIRHVLVKVITINALYHARVLDCDLQALSKYIVTIDRLDEKLKQGTAGVVDEMWRSLGTRHHYFSFATKFCSWHNQEAYAIYDRYVWQALVAYKTKGDGFTFKTSESDDFVGFIEIVKRFRKFYGLDGYSLKSIDKFLWQVGGRLIAEQEKASEASKAV